ncbi:MAG: hypothetical protein ABW171_12170 [Steroidobacter sp.]
MNAAWKLAWALPLVLAIGVGAMLLLRKFLVPVARQAGDDQPRMVVRQSLPVSEQTSVHLIEVDGRDYLVVESARQAVVQTLSSAAIEHSHSRWRIGPAWMRRQYEARVR